MYPNCCEIDIFINKKHAKKTWTVMRGKRSFYKLFFFFLFLGGYFMKGETNQLERDFQMNLIKDIKSMFKGCIVMKNDSSYIQGIPDLLILFKDKWCSLECKKSSHASKRPNQEYYVNMMNDMSFSRFIFPENKESVLEELKNFFGG